MSDVRSLLYEVKQNKNGLLSYGRLHNSGDAFLDRVTRLTYCSLRVLDLSFFYTKR